MQYGSWCVQKNDLIWFDLSDNLIIPKSGRRFYVDYETKDSTMSLPAKKKPDETR